MGRSGPDQPGPRSAWGALGLRALPAFAAAAFLLAVAPLDGAGNTPPLGVGVAGAATVVFSLYALALVMLFWLSRQRLQARADALLSWEGWSASRRRAVAGGVVGLLVLAVVGTGGLVVLVVLFGSQTGLQYLDFLLSSSVSLAVAGLLAVAALLASRTFRVRAPHIPAPARQTRDLAGKRRPKISDGDVENP
jgi:hypothetical protein